MFGWEDVYVTLSMSDLAKARDILEQCGVRYKWKVNEASSSPIGRPNMRRGGSIGLDLNAAKQYTLFVKKKDAEQARYLINKVLY